MSTESPLYAPKIDLGYLQYRSTRYFSTLDGLRCLSILGVIWHHAASSDEGSQFAKQGQNGVHLFFAISGFLITTLLLRERDSSGKISLGKFYARRSLRIFPLYYAVIALYVALTFFIERHSPPGRDFFHNLKYYLTYTSNWFVFLVPNKRIIFYFAWSLATEEQFYLVWPGIVKWSRSAIVPVGLMLMGTTGAVLCHIFIRQHNPAVPLALHIIGSVQPAICLGAVLAYVLHSPIGYRRLAAVLGQFWSLPVVIAIVVLCMILTGTSPQTSAALVLLVAALLLRPKNFLAPLLSNRIVAYLGTISYGMYMLHMIGMQFAKKAAAIFHAGPVVTFLFAIPLAVALASLSYWCFEIHFLKLKKKWVATPKEKVPSSSMLPRAVVQPIVTVQA